MNFDDKAKELIKALLMEKIMEDHPAEISAKMENFSINLTLRGRGCDILALALDIAEKTSKKIGISYDDFCEMLKKAGIKRILSLKRNLKIYSEIYFKIERRKDA